MFDIFGMLFFSIFMFSSQVIPTSQEVLFVVFRLKSCCIQCYNRPPSRPPSTSASKNIKMLDILVTALQCYFDLESLKPFAWLWIRFLPYRSFWFTKLRITVKIIVDIGLSSFKINYWNWGQIWTCAKIKCTQYLTWVDLKWNFSPSRIWT